MGSPCTPIALPLPLSPALTGPRCRSDDLHGGGEPDNAAGDGVAIPLDVRTQVFDANPATGQGFYRLATVFWNAVGLPLAYRLRTDTVSAETGQRGSEVTLAWKTGDRLRQGFLRCGHWLAAARMAEPYGKPQLDERQWGEPYRSSVRLSLMGNHQSKPDAEEFAARLHAVLDSVPDAPPRITPRGKLGRGGWLAKLFSVNKMVGSDWVNGHYIPTARRVLEMADRWGVSYEWLYHGRGSMRKAEPSTIATMTDDTVGAKSPSVRLDSFIVSLDLTLNILRRRFPQLPPNEKILELVQLIAESIEDGLPEARLLSFAERLSKAFIDTGGEAHATHARGANR